MVYAWQHDLKVDVFYVFTDMETWAGSVHPMQALRDYRWKSGINAKLITVAMTSTGFSIADPKDGCALDVVGFDSAAPAVMADFARG
jgi:60 kDa SS-A/Ro ribonucleoprotein